MSKEFVKYTFKVSLVVKRCPTEFAEGLGVGVLGSQEVTFIIPKDSQYIGTQILLNTGDALQKDIIEQKIECVSETPATEDEYNKFRYGDA